ncbi:MAG: hypothetical protein NUK65_11460 [Firmicutes bacterium]|nr:hypothetical protein [Bacillota bacterium]
MADAPKETKISDYENTIKQIRDVLSVSIVLGEQKEIEEIHILAEDNRNAKQVVRDIETLLRVEFGIDVDHKKISVVQLHKDQKLINEKRLTFSAITYSLQGNQLEAVVELSLDKHSCQGRSSGVNTRRNSLRLFAQAATDAISGFLEPGCTVTLEDVAQFPLGNHHVVSTTLTFVQGVREEYLVGSALIRQDEKEAVVRATLCAINRRVPITR